MKKKLFAGALVACAFSVSASSEHDLNKGYAALVFDDFYSTSGNALGAVFAGDDVSLNGYSIGYGHSSALNTHYLVAGGDIQYINGRQYVGHIIAGGQTDKISEAVRLGLEAGAQVTANATTLPVDFADAQSDMLALSASLAALPQTGDILKQWGGLYLTGDNSSGVQVFNLSGKDIQASHTFDVSGIPDNATIVFNISGDGHNFAPLNNKSYATLTQHRHRTIFNFTNATTLNLAGLQTEGVILAPQADITAPHGTATMPIVANSFSGSMELRGGAFIGQLPSDNAVCKGGLYAINYYGDAEQGYVHQIDLSSGQSDKVINLNNTASNIASHNGKLYFIDQQSSKTRASHIYSYDLSTQTQALESVTDGYKVIRLAYDVSGDVLKATSRTYAYDYDVTTGEKRVLGKMKASDEDFKNGDIAYSADGNTLYVLTGTALYSADANLELTLIGKHGVNWASGLAISPEGALYVSGRERNADAAIYELDPQTAAATKLFHVPHRVNDLTWVKNFCN
ncbi:MULTISPECIES: choice-of-anchor A family protein [unclassified Pseudoalteromonas]|uniref:choice-of-anchor A family protein n=1 Tax=unclassified Pseudoalteromonas TaxID=194690 RepID=UPI002097BE4E|nr:choice-of-anchor A family protein [Pseudoalteromonas sp. XMcav2-N]MCO7191229.1 choice-of-anchor A family protein [Pseudoalteromonas sp. XMcav2-N]